MLKPLDGYHKRKASLDGLTARCKECKSISDKNLYLRSSSKIRARVKRYRENFPDRKKASDRNSYLKRVEAGVFQIPVTSKDLIEVYEDFRLDLERAEDDAERISICEDFLDTSACKFIGKPAWVEDLLARYLEPDIY